MKKVICLILALLMCQSIVLPALAAESTFIPSNGPEVKTAVMEGEDVAQKLIVTSVTEAKEMSTDISQEARDLLVEVYDALSDGSMKLPVEGCKYVELSDVTYTEELTSDLTVTFEMKVEELEEGSSLLAFTYVEEEWKEVKSVAYDGLETVTCVFEELCPVVFVIVNGSGDAGENQSEDDGISASDMTVSDVAQDSFVPSITFKEGVEVQDVSISVLPGVEGAEALAEFSGEIDECVVVTSIAQAKDKSTDITQEDRDLLLEVYEKLEDGSMKLPLKGENVIKDLVDISFEYADCRMLEDHCHKDEILKLEGVTLNMDFNMGLEQDAPLVVLAYVDGEWVQIEKTEIGTDGVVSCVFEDICPVAFVLMEKAAEAEGSEAPWTGDMIVMWAGVMAICAVGIVTVLVAMKKQRK